MLIKINAVTKVKTSAHICAREMLKQDLPSEPTFCGQLNAGRSKHARFYIPQQVVGPSARKCRGSDSKTALCLFLLGVML